MPVLQPAASDTSPPAACFPPGVPLSQPKPVAEAACISSFFGVEVFAGTGRLTAELRAVGFRDSIGLDHVLPPRAPAPMLRLDLLHDSSVQLLFELLDNPFCLYIHLAPPHSTASRARLIQRTATDPPPTRNDQFPDGLPMLAPVLQARVAAANQLFALSGRIFRHAIGQGKLVSCENPHRSFFWDTSHWRAQVTGLSYESTILDHCCFGGRRRKRTLLVHNIPAFRSLAVLCPGESPEHVHAPWGKTAHNRWATSQETAYPLQLCRHMALQVKEQALARGLTPLPSSLADPPDHLHRAAQVALGQQPTGRKIPAMVPEFKQIVSVDSVQPILPGVRKVVSEFPLPDQAVSEPALLSLPPGARILRRLTLGGDTSRRELRPRVAEPSQSLRALCSGDPAEQYAMACLQKPEIMISDLTPLFDMLHSEQAARGSGSDRDFSWTSGAYAQGGLAGVRRHTKEFPLTSRLLCRFVSERAPGHLFSCVLLGRDLQGPPHVDKNNQKGIPNCILKLSDFEGGGLWLQNSSGETMCPHSNSPQNWGNVIDFQNGRIIFDPHALHCAMPWTGLHRDILVAFHPRNVSKLSTSQLEELTDVGFPLASASHIAAAERLDSVPPSSPAGPEEDAPSKLDPGLSHRTVVGIPWQPDEFIQRAACAVHPRHMLSGLPEPLLCTLNALASNTPEWIGRTRTEEMRKWISRARDLEGQEAELKETMKPNCRAILKSKRLLVFEEMLQASGHEDVAIAREMRSGFQLGGAIPRSEAFRVRRHSASVTMADLHHHASSLRQSILGSTKSSGDETLDRETYEATVQEVARGWLEGPLPLSSLSETSLVTRRFGVMQKGQIRPIDNYLESGVNSTASSVDTIIVHTADCIAAGLGHRMSQDKSCRTHQLQVRSWDLHKAYKNLPLADEVLDDSFLCVYNPATQAAELFKQRVLPFGSRHSVHSFCRVSLGIWRIAVTTLLMHLSVYFDDFVGAEIEPLSKIYEMCLDMLFKVLGWGTSKNKEHPFGTLAKVLGLEINLRDAKLGWVYLSNTPERQKEVFDFVSEILDQGFLKKKDGEKLRGRLQFAECQISGRGAGMAYKKLTGFIRDGAGYLDDEARSTLLTLRDRILHAPSRCVSQNLCNTMHLYVDASCEKRKVGLGGVLVNETGTKIGFFSEWASDGVVARMNPASGNPIFEFECLAILMGLRTWAPLIKNCNLVIFTDNDAALACMIRGMSDNDYGGKIVTCVHELSDEMVCNAWYERVNTTSNIADGPSRGARDESWGPRFEIDVDAIVDTALSAWG